MSGGGSGNSGGSSSRSGSANGSSGMDWHRASRLDEIPRLGARVVRFGEHAIALFRTSDDRVFALLDRCPHRGGPLSQGIVHGHCVTCPLHDWVIHLDSGEARAPDEGKTERFDVRLVDGEVQIRLPTEFAAVERRAGERPAAAAAMR